MTPSAPRMERKASRGGEPVFLSPVVPEDRFIHLNLEPQGMHDRKKNRHRHSDKPCEIPHQSPPHPFELLFGTRSVQ